MDNNNQHPCPPRLTSYDSAVDRKITNQYINNIQPIQRTSINIQNDQRNSMHIQNGQRTSMVIQNGQRTSMNIQNGQRTSLYIPGQRTSMHIPNGQRTSMLIPNGNLSPIQNGINNTYHSASKQNLSPQYSPIAPLPQRLSNAGDLSMQKINNGPNEYNMNVISPINNPNDPDFNTNFYDKNEKHNEKLGFFHIIQNLKLIFKQSKLSKWTLIFIILQVITIITLETLLFINYNYYFDKFSPYGGNGEDNDDNDDDNDDKKNYNLMKSVLIYQCIFIFAQLFVLVLYYDSFRISSSVQLFTTSTFNVIIAIYSCYQFIQNRRIFNHYQNKKEFENITNDEEYKQIYGFLIAISVILLSSAIVLLGMNIFLRKKFGWNIYRNVGADIQKTLILKRRYNFGIIIKFKAFFIFGIILQCYIFKEKPNLGEIFNWDNIYDFFLGYSAYILIGVFIINIICGIYAVKYESKALMVIHVITDIIFIVYAIFIIYSVFFQTAYKYLKTSLPGFAIIEILLILISIYFSVSVMADFNSVDLSENKHQLGRRLSL